MLKERQIKRLTHRRGCLSRHDDGEGLGDVQREIAYKREIQKTSTKEEYYKLMTETRPLVETVSLPNMCYSAKFFGFI